MSDGVEKSLAVGGLLVSLGIGGLLGFWPGVLAGGTLLFCVALIVFVLTMSGPGGGGGTA